MADRSGDIFVVRGSEELVALTSQPFPQEQDFQELLARHPELLAAGAGGRDLLLIRREAPIRHGEDGATGWLDHLFLDADGVPTLVEVKRSADSRIRREVVGQMLDYASNAAFGWPVARLQSFFETTCVEAGVSAEERLAEFLDHGDPETFWAEVKTNMQAGKLRLLFVADAIPSDLRRIIEFLNQQADPMEVLGVEVRRFVGEGVDALLPTVVGRTEESSTRKSVRASVKWNEQDFFAFMDGSATRQEIAAARRIFDWAQRCTYVWWGEGTTDASFVPTEVVGDTKHQVFAVYSGSAKSAACVYPYFQHYAAKPGFESEERRRELLDRFNAIDGIALPTDAISKRPRINLADLSSEAVEKLLAVFDWYRKEIGAAGKPPNPR